MRAIYQYRIVTNGCKYRVQRRQQHKFLVFRWWSGWKFSCNGGYFGDPQPENYDSKPRAANAISRFEGLDRENNNAWIEVKHGL